MSDQRKPQEAKRGQMAKLSRLPVFLSLEGKRAVLAGGSAAAAWKAELLSAAGAHVDVYAEEVSDEMRQLAQDSSHGAIAIIERAWRPEDFAGAAVAIGVFEHDTAAKEFCDAARHAGVPVNVIDKPAFCDFSFGAIVNRSPLVIGISTDGAAPVFAQAIRGKARSTAAERIRPVGRRCRQIGAMRSKHPVCLSPAAASSGSCSPRTRWRTRNKRRPNRISRVLSRK